MDGSIVLSMSVHVQGVNSQIVLEAAEDPGLFFIGGMYIDHNILTSLCRIISWQICSQI